MSHYSRSSIPLSVPHTTGDELAAVARVIESNWLASVGPETDAFESEFAATIGAPAALATSSGTAALHLALRVLGVGPGDDVLVSTLTFCASVNPILYLGARPVFVDAERECWNIDAALVAEELERRALAGRLPAAVIAVHLYGQLANMSALLACCARWGVPVIEDAAEGLGAVRTDTAPGPVHAGAMGTLGIFSFDGSKMITTSVGGMLVGREAGLVDHARKLARQAREPVAHYEHTEIGYNYRMSNLLAAVGRVQLGALDARVTARRRVFETYADALRDVPGITMQPEAPWNRHARWLSCLLVDREAFGYDRESLRLALASAGIESRAVWKPMHQQPVYRDQQLPVIGGSVADDLFARGLCLPSSSSLGDADVRHVAATIAAMAAPARC